jgi:hypothetical protein
MAKRRQSLREERDALRAKVAKGRKVERELSGQRQQAEQAADQARTDYIGHLTRSDDPTGGKSGYQARKLDKARARAAAGDWDEKVYAANRLIQAAEADLTAFLAEHGRGVIDELRAEAEEIPPAWERLVGQVAELAALYDQLSAEAGEALRAQGASPAQSIPPNPITAPLGTLKGTPQIPPPLPHHPGVLGTVTLHGAVATTDELAPGVAAFVTGEDG